MPKRWGVERSDGNAQGRDARSVLEYGTTAAKGRLCICSRATWTDDAQAVSFGFHMHEGFAMSRLLSPSHRLVAVNFFIQLAFQSTYFVGIIGCGTYVLGAGAFETSALVFGLNLVLIFATFCSGALVDSLGPRHVPLAVCVLLCASGVFGLVAPVSYSALALLAISTGLLFGAGTTAMDAYPRFLTEVPDELLRINGLNNIATSVAVIVGPALGGVIASVFSNQGVFFLLAVAPVPALLLATSLCEGAAVQGFAKPESRAEATGLRSLWEGVIATAADADLRLIFLMGFMGFFSYGAFDSLESLFYRDVLCVGTEWMGWLSAIAGIGGTLGSYLIMRVPSGRIRLELLAAMLLVTGVGSVVYVGTAHVAVAAVGQLVCGIGFGAMGPVRVTLTQRLSDPAKVGRVLGVMRVGLNGAGVLPLVVAPFLADAFGVQGVLVGASLATAAIACTFWAIARRRG